MTGPILLQGVPFVMRLGLTIAVRSLMAGDRLCWVDGPPDHLGDPEGSHT
jgi:hypothetical protein